MNTINEEAVRNAAEEIRQLHCRAYMRSGAPHGELQPDEIAAIISKRLAIAPEQSLPSYVVNCHRCGAKVELFASASAPEQFEDQLPADMPQEDYDKWYAQSRLSDGNIGVRVGPSYPFAPAQSPRVCVGCGHGDGVDRRGQCIHGLAVQPSSVAVWDDTHCGHKCSFPASVAGGGDAVVQRQEWLDWADEITGHKHYLASKMRAEISARLTHAKSLTPASHDNKNTKEEDLNDN